MFRSVALFGILVCPSLVYPTFAANRINKHTYASDDGQGDYEFVNTYFCDADTSSAPTKCAVDMKASCDGFAVHMVQSFVTKGGNEPPKVWYGYMSSLHANFTKSWDAFMHYGTTFYVDDLSKHLAKFQADKVPFYARKSAGDEPVYSLLVQTPSAKIMEIVSLNVSQTSLFSMWIADECPDSHARSLSSYVSTYDALKSTTRSNSLPSLLAIGINIPATEQTVNGIGAWLTKYKISGKSSSVETDSASPSCKFAQISYSNGVVRYVANPVARTGDKTVADYEAYQVALHNEYVGKNTGWDAFMDNHWCVGVDRSVTTLDSVAKQFAANNVSFHAHKSGASSVRSVGFNGESIELNGLIDGSYLKNLKGFDFCTADTDSSGDDDEA